MNNLEYNSYKILTSLLFLFSVGSILVHYSAYVQFMLSQGLFNPRNFNKLSRCNKMYRILFLSFLGPFIMIFVDVICVIESILISLTTLITLCHRKVPNCIESTFSKTINFVRDIRISPSQS